MPGRQSTGPPPIKRVKGKKRTQKRSLNALAIAEQQYPTKTKTLQNRLGASEAESSGRKRDHEEDDSDVEHDARTSKRPRAGDKDRYGNDIDGGSDSDGNEWVLGAVDEDDDSELDSDEAMGESDEENFEGFAFRGSSSTGFKKPRRTSRQSESVGADNDEIDLNEGHDEHDESAEESDGLGDNAIDLADAMDEGLSSDQSSGSDDEGGSDAHIFSDISDHEDAVDPKKLAVLETFVSNMNNKTESPTHPQPLTDAHESIIPSEYGITSKQKLTLADLQSSITDPDLRKSLKLIADDTKPSSKRKGIPKKLEVPLAKRQQDRLDRAAAYQKSKETLNRWIDTVKHNRRAEHISFPLKDNDDTIPQGSQTMLPTVNSKPVTNLESMIQNILQESGLGPTSRTPEEDAADTFTELPTNKLSLEEVQARRAELRRARDILFREEKRAKRIKKIKSKSYRKVHRKEREKIARSEKDALAAAGFEDSESERERNDRRRAEERMGQRHRESRWAKSVKGAGRAAWDEDARTGVTEMARRGEELRKRIEGKSVDEDGSSSESESSDDQDDDQDMEQRNKSKTLSRLQQLDDDGKENYGLGTRLSSLPFMKKAEAFRQDVNKTAVNDLRRALDGEDTPSEEEAAELPGRRSYGPLQNNPPKARAPKSEHISEFEEKPTSEDENEIRFEDDGEDPEIIVDATNRAGKSNTKNPSISRRRHAKEPPLDDKSSPIIEDNPWLATTTSHRHKKDRKAQNSRAEAIISNFPSANTALPSPSTQLPKPRSALKGARAAAATAQEIPTILPNPGPPPLANPSTTDSEDSSTEKNAHPLLSKNQALIRRAFAGDAVVSDFATEKAATTSNEAPQITDSTLPGWGSWVGAGVSKHERKRHTGRFLITTPGIEAHSRKDANLDRVIINEKRVKKNGRYLATQLPHPFETRAQYERSLRLPVGPEWTTKETFQGMTMPRVVLKQGLVLEPMRRPVV